MNEEVQPNGDELSRTADIVDAVLEDAEVCAAVKEHNDWDPALTAEQVAVKFLAQRFQEASALLSLRTHTLNRAVDGNTTRIVNLEDKVFDLEPKGVEEE